MLDRRSRAWIERDRDAFMSTISRSDPGFVLRQRRLWRWAAHVPFSSYRLVARWSAYGDLARPSDETGHDGADAVAAPLTQERYRLGRFDRRPARDDLFLTFVKEGGRWLIASDSDFRSVGLASASHLWDYGPVIEQRSEHFSLLSHPCGARIGCASTVQGLLALAEQGMERVDRLWVAPWPHDVVILLPTTTAELGALVQATYDLDNFVAFASSSVDPDGGFDYGGHRILLNPPAFEGRDPSSTLTILAHELLHVATRAVSGPFVPTVIEEGIASYVGYDADPATLAYFEAQVDAGNFDGRLPQDYEFITGSGADIFMSYQEAQSAVAFFVERWGLRGFVEFYRRLGARAVAPGTARHQLDRALKATIGMGIDGFVDSWADSIPRRT
ncbi:MAG: hypothetical protein ABR529_15565 [Actinomycetota bacterium]